MAQRSKPNIQATFEPGTGRYRDTQTGRFIDLPTQGTPGDLMPVSSSALSAIGYEAESRTLEVRFTSGSVYQYEGVPEEVYRGLRGAGSHGQYFSRQIRNNYPYRKG